jgi:predicted transcriptional regulator
VGYVACNGREPGDMYRENRESVILTLFGSSPKTRILDLFLDNPLFEFTKNEIIKDLGMAKSTLYAFLPELEKEGIIKETRKIGKASLYRLNSESPLVHELKSLIRAYVRESNKSNIVEEEAKPVIAE